MEKPNVSNAVFNDMLRDATFVKKPPNHPFWLDEDGCVPETYAAMAFPIALRPDGEGIYGPAAQTYEQVNSRHPYAQISLLALQLLIQMKADASVGTPMLPKLTRDNPQYPLVVSYYCRQLRGERLDKHEKAALASHVRQGISFDPVLADIIWQIQADAIKLRSDQGDGDGDDDDDDAMDIDDDEKKKEEKRGRGKPINETYLKVLQALGDHPKAHEPMEIREKVTVVMQRFDNVVSDGDVLGGILWFFIRDKNWNAGKALQNIIEAVERRRDNRYATHGRSTTSGGGGGGGYRGGPRFIEPYPHLQTLTEHVVFRLTPTCWQQIAAWVLGDPSILARLYTYDCVSVHVPGSQGRDLNPYNPLNLFTPEWALRMMERSFSAQLIDQHLLCTSAYYGCYGEMVWRVPPRQSYGFSNGTCFWHLPDKVGMRLQYFPWITVEAPIQRAIDKVVGMTEVDRMAPVQPLNWDPYDRSQKDVIVLMREVNARLLEDLEKNRPQAALHYRSPEYHAYAAATQEYRTKTVRMLAQLLQPGCEGVSNEFGAIISYFYQEVAPCMGAYVPTPIEAMDAFGNFMVRVGYIVKHDNVIVERICDWVLILFGSWDTYRWFATPSLHWGQIYDGISQAGKSFTVEDALKCNVPGTVTVKNDGSNRQWSAHSSFVDKIYFGDEAPAWLVDARKAEADRSGKVEEHKQQRTANINVYDRFEWRENEAGLRVGETDHIVTLFHAVFIFCTNKKIADTEEALSSRYMRRTVPRAQEPLIESQNLGRADGTGDRQAKEDQRRFWRYLQCMVAFVSKCQDAHVLPPVSMDLYDIISERMSLYLIQQGIDMEAIRNIQLMKRMARIFTIVNAINCVYNVAGAPHFGKPFEPMQLLDLIPYLYCTKQITLFVWTACRDIVVQPLHRSVIEMALSIAGINSDHEPNYEYSLNNMLNGETLMRRIQWKSNNPVDAPATYDLNYVQLGGEIATICSQIADQTQKKVSADDVKGALKSLKQHYITVKRLPIVDLAEYNKVLEGGGTMTRQINAIIDALGDDIPEERIPCVAIDYENHRVYVAREALHHFTDDIIMDAFCNIIHANFRQQTFLLGEQVAGHPGLWETFSVDAAAIEAHKWGESFVNKNKAYLSDMGRSLLRGASFDPRAAQRGAYALQDSQRHSQSYVIEEDLDDWQCLQHHVRCALPGDPHDSPAMPKAIARSIAHAKRHNHVFVALEREFWGIPAAMVDANEVETRMRHKQEMFNGYPETFILEEKRARDNWKRQEAFRKHKERAKRHPIAEMRRKRICIKPGDANASSSGGAQDLTERIDTLAIFTN